MSGNICKSITHNLASYSRVGVCSSARSELLKTSVEFEALGASVKWKHFPTVCLNLFKHSKPRVKVSNNVFYSEEVESKSMETINKTLFFHTARPKRLLLILVQSESTVQKQVLSQRERLLLLYFCPAKLFNSQTVRMKIVACVCVCESVYLRDLSGWTLQHCVVSFPAAPQLCISDNCNRAGSTFLRQDWGTLERLKEETEEL